MTDKEKELQAEAIDYYRKRIAELEKENAELERKLEQTEKDLADYQFNYPTIKELQKENAELKESCKIQVDTAFQMIYEKDEQLTKAKHIIIECIDVMSFHDCEYTDAYKEARDFILKDSEVEK